LCWNIVVVPPKVRAALVTRLIDSDDVLSTLEKPVLMTQGRGDTVVLPAMGDQILKTCPTSTASWYSETGHAPFLEDPLRFNRELADFVRKAWASYQKTEDQAAVPVHVQRSRSLHNGLP
jgi:non-heme chloroperoxidase